MALFEMPFMHRLRKSMAKNTYCRTRGKNVMKVKIDENTSKTPKQLDQRSKMKEAVRLCKAFNAAIHLGYPEIPVDFTEWNAFVSVNMGAISVNDAKEVVVDFESLLVAKGSLEPAEEVQVEKDAEAHTLSFTHLVESFGYGMNEDDQLYAVVLEQQKMRSRVYPLNERRDDAPAVVNVLPSWGMDNLLVYVFFLSADGRKASDSVFVPVK